MVVHSEYGGRRLLCAVSQAARASSDARPAASDEYRCARGILCLFLFGLMFRRPLHPVLENPPAHRTASAAGALRRRAHTCRARPAPASLPCRRLLAYCEGRGYFGPCQGDLAVSLDTFTLCNGALFRWGWAGGACCECWMVPRHARGAASSHASP